MNNIFKISLLTAGSGDRYYEIGLLSGILEQGILVDYIGGDNVAQYDIIKYNPYVRFVNLRGSQNPNAAWFKKIFRVARYYISLMAYSYKTDSEMFHIQWLNKFEYFDRTVLNIYYKILGKKIIFTAHNIDSCERDGKSTWCNKITLRFMYNIVDKIIVHTEKMKYQLMEEFKICDSKIHVVPHGINNVVRKINLDRDSARDKFNLKHDEKVILFFGNILEYKGLDILINALETIKSENIKIIIAGRVNRKSIDYWDHIKHKISEYLLTDNVILNIGFIDDKDIEAYFVSADVLILPYRYIFQSGLIFLAYNFGLPVIVTDVGSLKEEIVEGKTGYVCTPGDPKALGECIVKYYSSELYYNLDENRGNIYEYASEKYSWSKIGKMTFNIYKEI